MTHCSTLKGPLNSFSDAVARGKPRKFGTGVPALMWASSVLWVAATGSAWAESSLNTGSAAALAASARLDFRITIPRVIFLRVGSGTDFATNPTVDTVDFNVPDGASGSGAAVAGQSSAAITARVVGNGNNISFSATGTPGGLNPSGGGAPTVPWTQIVAVSGGGSLPHPAIGNGTAGTASSLVASGGVVDQSSSWSFSYRNNSVLPAGTYSGQVIYTAALP